MKLAITYDRTRRIPITPGHAAKLLSPTCREPEKAIKELLAGEREELHTLGGYIVVDGKEKDDAKS